jgi:hypothetical protein
MPCYGSEHLRGCGRDAMRGCGCHSRRRVRSRKRRVPEQGRLRPRVLGERRRAPAILKLGTEPSKEDKGWFRSALELPSIGFAVLASKATLKNNRFWACPTTRA